MTEADREREEIYSRSADQYAKSVLTRILYLEADVIGGWALPMNGGRPAIPLETNFGWSCGFVERLRLSIKDFDDLPITAVYEGAEVALLSFPGVYTYGHWIIDIAARLEVLNENFDLRLLKYIVPDPFPRWARPFIQSYNIKDEQLVGLSGETMIHVEKLVVPALMRVNDFLPKHPHGNSLKRLQCHAASSFPSRSNHTKLFVKHIPQTSAGTRPILGNADEVEELLLRRGFTSIIPASMGIDQQILFFRGARLIVGEDSSALHNCVWSEVQTSLIVLSNPTRHNILHQSICDLLHQKCFYLYGKLDDARAFSINVASLDELIS